MASDAFLALNNEAYVATAALTSPRKPKMFSPKQYTQVLKRGRKLNAPAKKIQD